MSGSDSSTLARLAEHWPEYAIEAALLGTFMVSACCVTTLVLHPRSPVAKLAPRAVAKRAIIGVMMGLTAVGLIYSGLGARSGAHMNPATTLVFYLLGRVHPVDAAAYMVCQFLGGLVGTLLATRVLLAVFPRERVSHAVTQPGRHGALAAWAAEFAITLGLMSLVLWCSNTAALAPYTGLLVGVLIVLYITFEAPVSGMSMNPARTLGSALSARTYKALWVYFTAPPAGMLAAAMLYVVTAGPDRVYCAKLNHQGPERCLFNCRIEQMPGRVEPR